MDLRGGKTYAFSIYHLRHGHDQRELFPIEHEEI
jgi:hypothetical protein